MIANLHIKNIGIIDNLEIELGKGLDVLTGETGAGKSLIIQSLGIIKGERFSKEMIRKGENQSYVEMCIYAPNDINSIDGNIIISREINTNGRNLCKINGRLVTVNELKNFMSNYIEIHGQNENQNLLDSSTHREYLDNYIGEEIQNEKIEYIKEYEKYVKIKKELKENYGDEKEKQRKLDLLKYQEKEIEEAKLKEGEEEKLEQKRRKYINAEKIANSLQEADEAIGENCIDLVSNAIRALEKIEQIEDKYSETCTNLKNAYYEIQEISRDINEYKEEIEFDENEREQIEERLNTIYLLKRKYGNNIQEILEYQKQTQQEIEKIENSEEYNKKLKKELHQIKEKMEEQAIRMHQERKEKAIELAEKINQELEELEMKNAKINIHVDYKEEFNAEGKDEIKIYIKTNLGEDEQELTKIASGGEMSRIMLAIKTVLAETDHMPILVFDEIDTGISGKAAKSVAEKLKKIAQMHQVICISHLASIAANADQNYYISKQVKQDRTLTNIKKLNEEETIKEIARISSGEINETTLKYANELRKYKYAKIG